MSQGNHPNTSPGEEDPSLTTPSREERLELEVTPKVTPVDLSKSPENPVIGEVPQDLLDLILADLSIQQQIKREDIQVIRAEQVVWSDGSLGCPKPDVLYTQAPVEGYWVVLEVGEVHFDYRVGANGYFSLCEGGGGLPISPPEDGTPKQ
jgi:hypothetical protein